MPKQPDPIDRYVGIRVRYFRTIKKWSQTQLGDKLNITFQQIQKYEKGTNRIGSGRLSIIAQVLGQPIAEFFPKPTTTSAEFEVFTLDHTQQTLRLVNAFNTIKAPSVRSALLGLAEEMVGQEAREALKQSGKAVAA